MSFHLNYALPAHEQSQSQPQPHKAPGFRRARKLLKATFGRRPIAEGDIYRSTFTSDRRDDVKVAHNHSSSSYHAPAALSRPPPRGTLDSMEKLAYLDQTLELLRAQSPDRYDDEESQRALALADSASIGESATSGDDELKVAERALQHALASDAADLAALPLLSKDMASSSRPSSSHSRTAGVPAGEPALLPASLFYRSSLGVRKQHTSPHAAPVYGGGSALEGKSFLSERIKDVLPKQREQASYVQKGAETSRRPRSSRLSTLFGPFVSKPSRTLERCEPIEESFSQQQTQPEERPQPRTRPQAPVRLIVDSPSDSERTSDQFEAEDEFVSSGAPTSGRRSRASCTARRWSLLTLNALSGHAPSSYIDELAEGTTQKDEQRPESHRLSVISTSSRMSTANRIQTLDARASYRRADLV